MLTSKALLTNAPGYSHLVNAASKHVPQHHSHKRSAHNPGHVRGLGRMPSHRASGVLAQIERFSMRSLHPTSWSISRATSESPMSSLKPGW